MINWIFFDLGSTIVDESECEEARLQGLLSQPGAPERGEVLEKIEEFISKNQNAYQGILRYYDLMPVPWPAYLEQLYPQVDEILTELKPRYRLGIIANQNPGIADRLKAFGIDHYFDLIVSSGELGIAKPDVGIFEHAIKAANCQPEETVMIGDRLDNDIVPAAKIGMKTVWIRQGMYANGSPEQLSSMPDHCIFHLKELLRIF